MHIKETTLLGWFFFAFRIDSLRTYSTPHIYSIAHRITRPASGFLLTIIYLQVILASDLR